MPKRSSKPDLNQNAFAILQKVTGGAENLTLNSPPSASVSETLDNTALRRQLMQEMGRRGGKKGGKARAKALSAEARKAIAAHAANKRWSKKRVKK